jgi:hypothetical protein
MEMGNCDLDRACANAHQDEISGKRETVEQQKRMEEPGGRRRAGACSGNFPRRYYPDRVQRVSLSLAALEFAREAPLFRQKSLDHESRSRCKPGLRAPCKQLFATILPDPPAFFATVRHSGTMPRISFAERSREIKRQLRR